MPRSAPPRPRKRRRATSRRSGKRANIPAAAARLIPENAVFRTALPPLPLMRSVLRRRMFDESNLHSLIARESRLRSIPHGKLLRESLQAAADGKFTIRAASGELSPDWRDRLRGLAAVAEAQ